MKFPTLAELRGPSFLDSLSLNGLRRSGKKPDEVQIFALNSSVLCPHLLGSQLIYLTGMLSHTQPRKAES